MPTYDYKCDKCGMFEVEQRISDPVLAACPVCKGKVRRLITGSAGVAFNVDGFYITDSRKKKDTPKKSENKK